jgi:hypothetical protein
LKRGGDPTFFYDNDHLSFKPGSYPIEVSKLNFDQINNNTMQTETLTALGELKQRLLKQPVAARQVFVGFDGFVDTIMKVVKHKHNYHNEFFKTIPEFASYIHDASGKSRQFELVAQQVKLGGNAPILFDALYRLGVPSHCAGSMGDPKIHPVFSSMDASKLISLANPGESHAIEFADGKIILSELSAFDHYDWKMITSTHGIDKIRKGILDSALVAFVDWANLPFASDIWDGVLHDIIKPSGRRDFMFFFDLCDPSKKTDEQIDEVLDIISCFSRYGTVTLGLNENETIKIWSALFGADRESSRNPLIPSVENAGAAVFKMINIDSLLVHPIDRTILFQAHRAISQKGRVVSEPRVVTGGGDNLNAGFIYGLLNQFPVTQCMLLGMATSGAYVQNGISSGMDAIRDYIDVWIAELQIRQPEPVVNISKNNLKTESINI